MVFPEIGGDRLLTNGKELVLSIITLILISPLVVMGVSGIDEEDLTRENEGPNPYCTFTSHGSKNYYFFGESGSFYIGVRNTYDGRLWSDEGNDPTSRVLYNARLEMKTSTLMHEGHEREYDCMDETEAGSLVVDNGQYDLGYTIPASSTRYYYSNTTERILFKFDVRRSGFLEGHYRINLSLYFNVRTGLNSQSDDGYQYSSQLEQEGSVDIYLNSYVENQGWSGKTMNIISNGQSITPYSGSRDLRLEYPPINCYPGTGLDQFRGELEFDDTGIEIEPVSTHLSTLTSADHVLSWKLNLTDDIGPGQHFADLYFKYFIEEDLYMEGPYIVSIQVRNTPLITPVSFEMDMNPTLLMEQKVPYRTIRINFTNNGNVPIWKVRILLDIDSSKYVKRYLDYFDEGEGSKEVYEKVEFIEYNIQVGQTITAEFEDLIISDIMPPGKYVIPFDYELTYRDPGSGSGSGNFLESYQMDEIGENEWQDIMETRTYPREGNIRPPHMVLKVIDEEPDLEFDSAIFLEPGTRYNEISIEVMNKEQYVMRDFSYVLFSDSPSWVFASNSSSIPSILDYDARRSIDKADEEGPGTFYIDTFVDVRSNIESVTTSASLETSFRDSENRKRWVNLSIPIVIRSSPAEIDVISVDTGEVKPGENFVVKVDIMNTGGTTIDRCELRMISRDSAIKVPQPIVHDEPIEPGDVAEVTFYCTAGEQLDPERSYDLDLMTSLVDKDGNYDNYSMSSDVPVTISGTEKPQEEDITGSINFIGIIILIGMIVSAVIIGAFILISNMISKKKDRSDDSPPPLPDLQKRDPLDEILNSEKNIPAREEGPPVNMNEMGKEVQEVEKTTEPIEEDPSVDTFGPGNETLKDEPSSSRIDDILDD